MSNLWMKKEVFKEDVMIVDCGYVTEQHARDRADKLLAFGISNRHLGIELMNRILFEIPKRKRADVMREFPIIAGETYFGATHRWDDGFTADGQPSPR